MVLDNANHSGDSCFLFVATILEKANPKKVCRQSTFKAIKSKPIGI